jgi:hypothetical protein
MLFCSESLIKHIYTFHCNNHNFNTCTAIVKNEIKHKSTMTCKRHLSHNQNQQLDWCYPLYTKNFMSLGNSITDEVARHQYIWMELSLIPLSYPVFHEKSAGTYNCSIFGWISYTNLKKHTKSSTLSNFLFCDLFHETTPKTSDTF